MADPLTVYFHFITIIIFWLIRLNWRHVGWFRAWTYRGTAVRYSQSRARSGDIEILDTVVLDFQKQEKRNNYFQYKYEKHERQFKILLLQ